VGVSKGSRIRDDLAVCVLETISENISDFISETISGAGVATGGEEHPAHQPLSCLSISSLPKVSTLEQSWESIRVRESVALSLYLSRSLSLSD
jgi:hypothetical protein